MMKSMFWILTLGFSLITSPQLARADTAAFDKTMAPLVVQYSVIHKALAGDTAKGVEKAAKKLIKLAPKLKSAPVKGKHAAHYAKLPMKIKAAATALSNAKGIADQRKAFMALSRPFAMWATMSKPQGLNVVFCSMAKGSWLQRHKTIANPYYGAKMLRCGEVVSGQHKGTAGGHMKHGLMH